MTEKQVAIICNSKTDITPNPKNTKAQTVMGFYDYAVLGNFLVETRGVEPLTF
jgi:hypothetical protein